MAASYSIAEQTKIESEEHDIAPPSAETSVTEKPTAKSNFTETSEWRFLHPYHATYLVVSEGDVLGQATRELSKNDDSWSLDTFAKIKKLLLTLKSSESTKFNIDSDQLFGIQFSSKTKMTFKKTRRMNQEFDWANKLEIGNRGKKKWQLPIEYPIYDRVSHLLQLRADLLRGETNFQYPVSYKGKHLKYTYLEGPKELITTKMGDLEARKFVRQKSDDETFIVWLAPELNFFPIKIAQYENGKPDITLLLNKLQYVKPNISQDIK